MLVDKIISISIDLLKAFMSLFPVETTLPWGTDSYVATAIYMFKGFMDIFPPMLVIFTAISIYIGFELVLMLWQAIPIFGKVLNKRT